MLDKLVAIQRREDLSDTRMAELLGMSRPWWSRVKHGHLRLSEKVAVRAAGVWPELTRDLLDLAAVSTDTNGTRSAA